MTTLPMNDLCVSTSMNHRRHENYLIDLESFQTQLQVAVHALYSQVCPYVRQYEIVKLVKPFLHTGMHLEGLFLATQVGAPSIYLSIGVVTTVEEVTTNHLH